MTSHETVKIVKPSLELMQLCHHKCIQSILIQTEGNELHWYLAVLDYQLDLVASKMFSSLNGSVIGA